MNSLLKVVAAPQRLAGEAGRARKKGCGRFCWRWSKWLLSPGFLFVGIAIFFFTQGGNRTLEGVAKATDAVAEVSVAAGNLAGATANATVAVTGLALEAVVVATSAAEEAYRGVDVLDMMAQRTTCKAVGNSPGNLSLWVSGGADGALSSAVVPPIAGLVRTLSVGVPSKEISSEKFDVHGNFWQFSARARLRTDGSAVMAAWVVNVSFATQWTNPIWEGWGFRIDAESQRIIDRMKKSLEKLGPLPAVFYALDDQTIMAELGVGLFTMVHLPPARFRWDFVASGLALIAAAVFWQWQRLLTLVYRLRNCAAVGHLLKWRGSFVAAIPGDSSIEPQEPDGTGGSPIQEPDWHYITGGLNLEGLNA